MKSKDIERARQIYQECLKLIPHKKFTFAKIWLMKAHFEIRQQNLSAARKTLGQAIGMCPKDKLFKGYVELELKLFEFVRCRTLYEKHIEWNPANCQAWIKFAELERGLDDLERTRAIFELAIDQPVLDMPELLWKAYIDFEEEEGEYDRTRELYERLLEKTDHVKVWISYAHFEINVPDEDEEEAEEEEEEKPVSELAKARARKVFERALKSMKDKELKEEVSKPIIPLIGEKLTNPRESHYSMHGFHSRERMARRTISRKCRNRCQGRRRDVGSWTTTATRSISTMCSLQMIDRQRGYPICWLWLSRGNKLVGLLLGILQTENRSREIDMYVLVP
jgi:tetratricopeptide (TPR) repeat protein